ncbi:DEAD/DEAH box helicase [Mobilicoccus pelagius]|uniref:Putative helicase n=1 Tax=Mobilicoccus pelagius NBRC 104925 TaxID=1089455 RepID=H5UML9_9MICO|nr:DEAD/DEAH box helicase [Mobilicoccus pelagius]GAB46977.1 putative helicase [Mobilicoccus pelagius NBRC 104925]
MTTTPPPTLADVLDEIPAPADGPRDPDDLFAAFVDWVVASKGVEPYPHQEEALLELVTGSNVILATPTGSGKSLVAMGAHFFSLAEFARTGRRTYYTAPIKALVSERFFDLCATFGAQNVGMLTGDAAVNAGAPIVCCTAEVLANIALREGTSAPIGQVVMDEFHFYSEPDRGWAWQVPLLELPQAQFLLMSATLGDVSMFEEDLTRRTGRDTAVVAGAERPVPLSFSYALTPLHETLEELLTTHQAPVYVVHFTQAAALEQAQALMSINVCTKDEKAQILAELRGFRFATGFGQTLQRLVKHGIGVHHAGMLPKYRRLVETLAQKGLLKVICGTDTLGVGINVPIRTVVLTGLTKFDGTKQRLLKSREFHQIAGRAGRAGFDTSGSVVVQAPEHVIENHKALLKAGDDEKKRRKVQRKKPPEGFVNWSEDTFDRVRDAEPEAMVSRMRVSHAMILNMIQRDGDAVAAVRRLLTDNHDPRRQQTRLQKQAIEILRTLLDTGVVERLPEPDETGRSLRVVEDLQRGFALNQPLSPFALAALELLDLEDPLYALDVLSVIESTLDDPRPVLRAQQFKARGEAVAEMKADGIEYEERMELLEDVSWPRPLEELLEAAYETYRQTHPWLDPDALSPKSVVRDLYERAMTFGEFVAFYELTRAEGIVLRYLSDAYKAMRQTVPDAMKTDELDDLIEWLGEIVRQTDSSLLDEWETLTDPDLANKDIEEVRARAAEGRPFTANVRALRVLVRNALWQRVELAARNRVDALGDLDAPATPGAPGMDADDWADALDEYFEEHDEIGLGPDARGPAMFVVDDRSEPGYWIVQQIIADPAGDHDWRLWAEVDLDASDEAGELVMRVTDLGRLD